MASEQNGHSFWLDLLLLLFIPWVFTDEIQWLWGVFTGWESIFNILVLLAVLYLFYLKFNESCFAIKLDYQSGKLVPLITVLISSFAWFYSKYVLALNIFSALSFLIFCFGVMGLFISQDQWKRLLLPFSLLAMTLPFGQLLDIYVGFPLRMASVNVLVDVFQSAGIEQLSSSTIITIENEASQIDLSCSGIKGLWAGSLFYASLSWLKNYKVNLAWMIGYIILILLLIAGNLFRIFTLVYLDLVLQMDMLAEVAHGPLGIFGFISSCFLSLIYLKFFASSASSKSLKTVSHVKPTKLTTLVRTVVLVVLILSFTQIDAAQGKSDAHLDVQIPSNLNPQPALLTQGEKAVFQEQNCTYAKVNFKIDSVQASVLIVRSENWRGHHMPEYCMRGSGREVKDIRTQKTSLNQAYKFITLDNGLYGLYWFQSRSQITEDYTDRVWTEISNKEGDWVMVSMIVNPHNSNFEPEVFVTQLTSIINTQIFSDYD